MIEILWHGRGGQGAFTAARLLGAAGSLAEGRYGLAFPSFGPERRGAPMRAFTKLDGKPIGDRSAITTADVVVYLDSTLFGPGWDKELKPGGIVLVNTAQRYDDPRILGIDASSISKEILGRDIPNTVFLAAISHLIDELSVDDACEAIRQYMAPKLHAKNIAIVETVVDMLQNGAQSSTAANTVSAAEADKPQAPSEAPSIARPSCIIPSLQDPSTLDPRIYAKNTCWEAGHLVSKNAGWRTSRPVIDTQACRNCLLCYLLCPDGTIFHTDDIVAIDYDFCKGCGVCEKSCPFHAIAMVPEITD